MKKLLFLGTCLVAFASQQVMAQTGGADMVTVRITEESRYSRLWINWPGREPEVVEFEWNDKASKGANAGKGYEAALNKLYQQGYRLQGVVPGLMGGGPAFFTNSTLVFVKDK